MSHYENVEDEKAKQETFRCAILAAIVVFSGFCAMIYGLAWMSSVTVTAEDIYARRRMDNSIKVLRRDFDNHRHHFWTGKVK